MFWVKKTDASKADPQFVLKSRPRRMMEGTL
jgi:hypothetical protein